MLVCRCALVRVHRYPSARNWIAAAASQGGQERCVCRLPRFRAATSRSDRDGSGNAASRSARQAFQRLFDHRLDPGIVNRARRTGARFVAQTVNDSGQKKRRRHLLTVTGSIPTCAATALFASPQSTTKSNPGAQRQSLRRLTTTRERLQLIPIPDAEDLIEFGLTAGARGAFQPEADLRCAAFRREEKVIISETRYQSDPTPTTPIPTRAT